MWVETQPSAQSSIQKLNVDNSCEKTRKIRYYIFEVLSNFTVFLYFLPNILARIVDDFHFFSFVMEETTVIFGKILLRYHTKLAVTIFYHLIWFLPIIKNSLQGTD